MAVAFDAKGTAPQTDGGSPTNTFDFTNQTVGAGSNRALLVVLTIQPFVSGAPTGISATWDPAGANQAMTLIGTLNDTSTGNANVVQLWGLLAPTSGNKTLRVSWTNNCSYAVDTASYTGVDQTAVSTSFANFASAQGSGATASVTVTSATNNIVIANHATSTNTTATSGTQIYVGGLTNPRGAANYDTGAATVNMQATQASGGWASIGCDIVAVGAIAGGMPPGGATIPWGNPVRRFRPELTWIQSFDLTLFANIQPLIGPYDWPNPQRPRRNENLYNFTGRYNLNLIGQDQFPARNYDFPNPWGPRRLRDYTWINQTPQGTPAAPFPTVITFDWPNPSRGPLRGREYGFVQGAFPANIPAATFPISITFDWPNPIAPRRVIDLITWTQSNPLLLNATPAPPFVPVDFPNPKGARRAIDLVTWVQSNPTLLNTPATATPFIPPDFPNPVRRTASPSVYSWFEAFNPNLFPPVTPVPPFDPFNTPVGTQLFSGRRRYQTEHNRYTLPNTSMVPTYDWPNPRGPQRMRDYTWISQSPQVIPAPPPPATQVFDWPNPTRRKPNYDLLTWISIPPQVIPLEPFPTTRTFDWPNPRGPLYPTSLRTWTQGRAPYLPTDNPPIRQYDWPNPKGARRSVLLYTWTAGPQPSAAPPPVVNPNLMIKNSVVRVRWVQNSVVRVRWVSNST